MNKIRLGKAIWSSFCLKFTWNYDSEVEKTCLKGNYWKQSLKKLPNHLFIIMSIMDEHPHFQKQFVCIQWYTTIAVSEQGLFQHEINCVFQNVSQHYFLRNEEMRKVYLRLVLFFFFNLIKQRQDRADGTG